MSPEDGLAAGLRGRRVRGGGSRTDLFAAAVISQRQTAVGRKTGWMPRPSLSLRRLQRVSTAGGKLPLTFGAYNLGDISISYKREGKIF